MAAPIEIVFALVAPVIIGGLFALAAGAVPGGRLRLIAAAALAALVVYVGGVWMAVQARSAIWIGLAMDSQSQIEPAQEAFRQSQTELFLRALLPFGDCHTTPAECAEADTFATQYMHQMNIVSLRNIGAVVDNLPLLIPAALGAGVCIWVTRRRQRKAAPQGTAA